MRASLLPICLLLLTATVSCAFASEYRVTTPADSGPGSLRDALSNAEPGRTVVFERGVNVIPLAAGAVNVNRAGVTVKGNVVTPPAFDQSGLLAARATPFRLWKERGNAAALTTLNTQFKTTMASESAFAGTFTAPRLTAFEPSVPGRQIFFQSGQGSNLSVSGIAIDGVVEDSAEVVGGLAVGGVNLDGIGIDSVLGTIFGSSFSGGKIRVSGSVAGGALVGTVARGHSFAARIGAVSGTLFHNNAVDSDNVVGGGIIGAYVESDDRGVAAREAELAGFSGTLFSRNAVMAQTSVFGGGIAGALAHMGGMKASAGPMNGTRFAGNTVGFSPTFTGQALHGGGVYGAAGYYGAESVGMGRITDSSFSSNTVAMHSGAGTVDGGGVSGAATMADNAFLGLAGLSNSVYDHNAVSFEGATGTLRGGGVHGAASEGAAVALAMDSIDGSVFAYNYVAGAAAIRGGGVWGGHGGGAGADVAAGKVRETLFVGNAVDTAGRMAGGGVAGIHSAGTGRMDDLTDSIFHGNTVAVGGDFAGGGIIGMAVEGGGASLGTVKNAIFAGNAVSAGTTFAGGGLIGGSLAGAGSTASAGRVDGSVFIDNAVGVGGDLRGGGAIGWNHAADGGSVSHAGIVDSAFSGNTFEIDGSLHGGGIAGGYAGADNASLSYAGVSGTVFSGNVVKAGSIAGGGIFGLDATGAGATLGVESIRDTVFEHNTIASGGDVRGGIVGLHAAAGDATVGMDRIANSRFENNAVSSAGGDIYAGVLYSAGLGRELVIENSSFVDNAAAASGDGGKVRAGAIGIDTRHNAGGVNVLTLQASGGGTTVFSGNSTGEASRNAVYFGGYDAESMSDAVLNIRAGEESEIRMADPILVEMRRNADLSFRMNIEDAGRFVWGGMNVIDVAGPGETTAVVAFNAGSKTVFLEDYKLVAPDGSEEVVVELHGGSSLAVHFGGSGRGAVFGDNVVVKTVGTDSRKISLEAVYLGFDDLGPSNNTLVLTDQHDLEPDDFILVSNSWIKAELTEDGRGVVFDNSALLKRINSYANIKQAYQSGALKEAWNLRMAAVGAGTDASAAFEQAVSSTLFSDQVLGGGMASLAMFDRIQRQALWLEHGTLMHQPADAPTAAGNGYASLLPVSIVPRPRVWAGYVGGSGEQSSGGGHSGHTTRYNGLAVGMSADMSVGGVIGGYFSSSRATSTFDEAGGRTKTDAHQGGVYAMAWPAERLRVTLDAAVGLYYNELTNSYRQFDDDINQTLFGFGAEARYECSFDPSFDFEAFGGLNWRHLNQDGVNRHSSANVLLQVGGVRATSFSSALGFELSKRFEPYDGFFVRPAASVAWRHEFADRRLSGWGSFSGSGLRFPVYSAQRGCDSIDLSLSLAATLRAGPGYRLDVNGGYELSHASGFSDHGWRAGLVLSF